MIVDDVFLIKTTDDRKQSHRSDAVLFFLLLRLFTLYTLKFEDFLFVTLSR